MAILIPVTRSGEMPVKFEDAELEALLDQDSFQTEEGLAETLGVTQQEVANNLKVTGLVQGNWVPYELRQRDVGRRFSHANDCSRQSRNGFFFSES